MMNALKHQSRSKSVLQERWENHVQDLHLQRLAQARALVHVRNEAGTRAIFNRGKKEQLMEEKYTEIERENRMLLERLSDIMKKKSGFISTVRQHHRSLNIRTRKRELKKITHENQEILKRLQNKKSYYSITQWDQENAERSKILKKLCAHPYQLVNHNARYQKSIQEAKEKTKQAVKRKDIIGKSIGDLKNVANKQSPKKLVVCKKLRQLGNYSYLVEVSLSQGKMVISAFHTESSEVILVEVSSVVTQQILRMFKGNYDLLVKSLSLVNNKLIIVPPEEEKKSTELSPKIENQKLKGPMASQKPSLLVKSSLSSNLPHLKPEPSTNSNLPVELRPLPSSPIKKASKISRPVVDSEDLWNTSGM